MGCGKSKSKQDVATGNTVVTTRKNSFNNNNNNADESKRGDATEVLEILPENSTTVIEESIENVNKDDDHEKEKVESAPEVKEEVLEIIKTSDNQEKQAIEPTVVIDNVDDAVANDVDAVEAEEEMVESSGGRLICRDSPNTFFSSRKDHGEASGSIVSDMSFDFESPRHEKESQIDEESATIVDTNSAKEEEETVETVTLETPGVADEEKDAKVSEEIIEITELKN